MEISLPFKFLAHFVRQLFSPWPQLLQKGEKAPDFSIYDESGELHTLEQYRGKKVVLFFFIRANTPG